MYRNLLLLIFVLGFTAVSSGLEYTTYCSVTKGYDIQSYGDKLFAGTDGGLIEYSSGSPVIYDIDDGIYKPSVQHIEKDFRNNLWLGHSDCSVTVFDAVKKKSQYLNDIELSGAYSLNGIYSSDKFIYIASGGLLARYKYNTKFAKYEIADTNLMTGNVSCIAVHEGFIFAAAAAGVISIREDAANINDISLWSAITGFDSGTALRSFVSDGLKLYALTSNGIYSVSGTAAVKLDAFKGSGVFFGRFYGGKFYASVQDVGAIVVKSTAGDLTGSPEVVCGSSVAGELKTFTVSGGKIYWPAAGVYKYFDIETEDEGSSEALNLPKFKGIKKVILTAGGERAVYMAGRNFAFMDVNTHYFDTNLSQASFDFATNLIESTDGSIYTGTWGNGVRKFRYSDNAYTFEKTYSFGGANNVSFRYPVHPGLSRDRDGNIWVTNWDDSRPDSVITVINPAGAVINSFKIESITTGYDIFVDHYKNTNWVWLGGSKQTFGTSGGMGVGKYDGSGLAVKQIALNDGVIDITRDKSGTVWIATNNGIKYIDLNSAPANPLSLTLSNVNSINSGPVSNFIYDVEVNGINEKWFATDKGVSVLSADNSVWRHYVTRYFIQPSGLQGEVIRTGLIDQTVTDIEFDEKNGIAILASTNGLVFLEYGKIFKSGSLPGGELQTKPSPFINDGSSVMGFYFPDDGSNYDTAKIFDMQGTLIRGGDGGKTLNIYSGWDGRDNSGKLVSTGIYQVICYTKSDRTKKITGKIAVVMK
jgi:hypothetical protein